VKLVTAIVRPEMLDELIVTEVRGFGRQFGERRKALLLTKVRLDILVPDEDAQAMADGIAKQARTGVIGDGKIWASDVHSVLRVRTGERDRDAV
jgi:nitrogen regulatory protein PII